MDDIGKLIKSGRLELKNNGALTNRGIQMAKAMASSRGDGKFVLKARASATQVTDEASRIEAYNKANRTPEQVAADKEVSMAADTIFGDLIEASVAEGVVDNANKIRNKILAGLKNSMTDEVYGAVVRRLDDWANIRKTIVAHVPITNGEVQETGDFELDGVTFPAAEVQIEFMDPADGEGAMFPTGNLVDELEFFKAELHHAI